MRYKILQNGKTINIIESDSFFIKTYCDKNGYSYIEDPAKQLKNKVKIAASFEAQLNATLERQEFLEDCIAEMATQVYS